MNDLLILSTGFNISKDIKSAKLIYYNHCDENCDFNHSKHIFLVFSI